MLECPENTPKSIYRLMTQCWSSRPVKRPDFRTLFRNRTNANLQSNNAFFKARLTIFISMYMFIKILILKKR
jgi:hypothetical protein